MIWIPTKEYVIALYEVYIEKPVPLMNHEGLRSTLDKVRWGMPFKSKPTIWEQVAILYKEIVENHYFADGNKRIGILIGYLFLSKNDFDFQPPKGEVYSMTMKVARKELSFEEIKNWFKKNSTKTK